MHLHNPSLSRGGIARTSALVAGSVPMRRPSFSLERGNRYAQGCELWSLVRGPSTAGPKDALGLVIGSRPAWNSGGRWVALAA